MTFTFSASTSAPAQEQALEEIGRWNGVVSARFLKPGARNPAIARMAYVVLDDEVDPESVVRRLEGVRTIESASIPAARYLAGQSG